MGRSAKRGREQCAMAAWNARVTDDGMLLAYQRMCVFMCMFKLATLHRRTWIIRTAA